METLAPVGPVYQAGTLSGNPLAMAAGVAALTYIKNNPNIYSELEEKASWLENAFKENLNKLNKNFAMNRVGSMSCMFFTENEVTNFDDAVKSDVKLYAEYFHGMLKRGIYLAPSQFEAMFISTAHSNEMLEKTANAHYETLKEILG